MDSNRSMTPVQKFYSGKCILITGSTGFVGKVLVEKLLRAFPDVGKLILIVRDKKGKSGFERMEEYFDRPLFSKINNGSAYKSKICPIVGDMTSKNLGLSQEDIEMITKSVNIIFHVAATVSFNVPLKKAVMVNVRGSSEIVKLSKKMSDLKSIIYVSTAYNHFEKFREEKVYPHPVAPETLIQIVDVLNDDLLNKFQPLLLGKWLNVYTYTKNAAENLFADTNCPTGIFRPSLVYSTLSEPFPSWTDSLNGPTGMVVSASLGLKRVIKGHPTAKAHIIPVDMVVNAMIAIAWDVAQQRNSETTIYNYTPEDNAVNWKNYMRFALKDVDQTPFDKAIWYKTVTLTNRIWMYHLIYYTLELLPAAIFDCWAFVVGRKLGLTRKCQIIHNNFMLLSSFGGVWKFDMNNVKRLWDRLCEEDRSLLNFNVQTINWEKYLSDSTTGIKRFYFKEDMTEEGLRKVQQRYRMFFWLHEMVKVGSCSLSLAVLHNYLVNCI